MQTQPSSHLGATALPRRERPLPRLNHAVPVALMQHALGWVIHLLRLRHAWGVKNLAKTAQISQQTVRDFERGSYTRCYWDTFASLCHALHRHPDQVAALARRWLMKYAHREQAQQQDEPQQRRRFPWQHKRCQTPHGMPEFRRQAAVAHLAP